MKRLLEGLEHRAGLEGPLTVHLAGGMAVHLYAGARVTTDVDAEFGARIGIPNDLAIDVLMEDGSEQAPYFDTNYNPMFGLLHERYQDDSIELDLGLRHLRVFVLSPLDLAVSKLARFADNDRADVLALVRPGLVTADELEARAREALLGLVGGQSMPRMNIDDAVRLARDIETDA